MPLYRVRLPFPGSDTELLALRVVEACPEDCVSSVVAETPDRDGWIVEWIFESLPDLTGFSESIRILLETFDRKDLFPCVASLESEELPDINWLEASLEQFAPFRVGPFFVHGSHCAGDDSLLSLTIDAATAFGTGEHGSTRNCLLALETLRDRGEAPARFLDIGTGSGILSVAACALWENASGVAVDNDPEAVRVAARHIGMNGFESRIAVLGGTGCDMPEVRSGGPYDLVMANVIASVLTGISEDVRDLLKVGGYAILSGLLPDQENRVLETYKALGFSVEDSSCLDGWVTAILRRV